MKQEIINELSERYTVVDGKPPIAGRSLEMKKAGAVKVNNLWTWYLSPVVFLLDLSTLDTIYVEETEEDIIITGVRENVCSEGQQQ